MPKSPSKDEMDLRDRFSRAVEETFPDLSEEKRRLIVNYGLREYSSEVGLQRFLEQSAKQPNTPMKWADAPAGLKFEEFMRLEYLAKGILKQPGFDLSALRAIDGLLADAYVKQNQRKALPEDIQVEKARARLNRRERTGPDSH